VIIVDRIDSKFQYTVLDQHHQVVATTEKRVAAIEMDQEVNQVDRSTFVPRINYNGPAAQH
jgi:hypothetical protein